MELLDGSLIAVVQSLYQAFLVVPDEYHAS
jgi:hypothetical protein